MITNQQISKLERLLDQTGQEHMPGDVLQGFLAAVGIGPHAIPPSQWLPFVFLEKDQVPRFEGNVDPDWLMKSLFDFYNATLDEIQNYKLDIVISSIEEDGKQYEDVSGWCRGFCFGLNLWGNNWEASDEDGTLFSLLVPIIYMADFEDQGPSFGKELLNHLMEHKDEFEAEIPELVSDIWAFWAEKRMPTTHRAEHIGRNDPCPCGSGKKYKKCCGAT